MASSFGDGERGEADAERLAEIQHMHLPMKKWYAEPVSELLEYKEAWGEFPSFWKEAINWEPYREVRRAYLAHQDGIKYVPLNRNTSNGNIMQTTEEFKDNSENIQLQQTTTLQDETKNLSNNLGSIRSYDEIREERKQLWGNKRKSRFGKDVLALSNTAQESEKEKKDAEHAAKFSSSTVLTAIRKQHDQCELTPEEEQELVIDIMKVDALCEKLKTVVQDAAIEALDPNRPPSPPPKYDVMGARVNTREVRMRDQLLFERGDLIKSILKRKPHYVTPPDYIREKPKRKLYIPIKEYPNYNFIGLVIGPRGITQKAMEKESGAKIVIRGRGSSKEGSKNRTDGGPDDDDQLHVLIAADTEKQVEIAVKLVMPLLQPMEDSTNIHKAAQLQQLAKLNGTEKDELAAHARFNEQMGAPTFMANIKCGICGEPHATRDCPVGPSKNTAATMNGVGTAAVVPPANMDQEYANLMSELNGTPKIDVQASKTNSIATPIGSIPGIPTMMAAKMANMTSNINTNASMNLPNNNHANSSSTSAPTTLTYTTLKITPVSMVPSSNNNLNTTMPGHQPSVSQPFMTPKPAPPPGPPPGPPPPKQSTLTAATTYTTTPTQISQPPPPPPSSSQQSQPSTTSLPTSTMGGEGFVPVGQSFDQPPPPPPPQQQGMAYGYQTAPVPGNTMVPQYGSYQSQGYPLDPYQQQQMAYQQQHQQQMAYQQQQQQYGAQSGYYQQPPPGGYPPQYYQ